MKKSLLVVIFIISLIITSCNTVNNSDTMKELDTIKHDILNIQYDSEIYGSGELQDLGGIFVINVATHGSDALNKTFGFDIQDKEAVITFTFSDKEFVDFEKYVESVKNIDKNVGNISNIKSRKIGLGKLTEYKLRINSRNLVITRQVMCIKTDNGYFIGESFVTDMDKIGEVTRILESIK